MSESAPIDGGQDWLPEPFRAEPVFKNFKSVEDLANSYKSAASMVGMDKGRVLALPKEDTAPEWDSVWKALGRPDKPEEYGIAFNDNDADKPLWEKALPEIHKLGLTKKQVEGLRGMMGQMGQEYAQQFADPAKAVEHFIPRAAEALASEAFADATAAMLKQKWGGAHDDKFHAAQRVAGMFADTQDADIAKLFKAPADGGYGLANLPGFIAMLAEMGERMAEPGGLTGGAGQNQNRKMTPTEGANRLAELQSDREFGKRLAAGDREAVQQWEAAIEAVAPKPR